MDLFFEQFTIQFFRSLPLFILIALGYGLGRWGGFTKSVSNAVTKFAFNVTLTAMLFRLLANQHKQEVTTDSMLLIAFFGTCLILLFVARLVAVHGLRLAPVASAVFGTGSVFCNIGLLGIPLATVMLGEKYLPCFAAVITFNSMILWTVVSIFVELSQGNGRGFSFRFFLKSLAHVFKNPLILSIFSGVICNLLRVDMPYVIDESLRQLGTAATPLSLLAVGMGLAEYGIGKGLTCSVVLSVFKLLLQPFCVFCFAQLIHLGAVESLAITFIAALPCGVNVYLMAKEFQVIEGEVANAMVITTLLASITMPFVVTVLHWVG